MCSTTSKTAALMEMPTFGRRFHLGMLYDAISDKLIQGNELWDQTTIEKATQDKPHLDTQFSVILDDSLAAKCRRLGANSPTLKANLLSGMTHVSGASKFFTDHKTTKEVLRVSVQFRCSSHTQEITVQQLGTVQNQAAIGATRATHVTSKILFGLKAFLIIDRPYTAEENVSMIQKKLSSNAQFLADLYESGKSDLSEIDLKEAKKYNFRLYSDAPLPVTSPASFEEVVAALQDLFKFFKQGSSCSYLVPKKVWLYPLSELDSSAPTLVQEVSTDVISQLEKITDDFIQAEVWINDIGKNNPQASAVIPGFKMQQTRLIELITRFHSDTIQQLSSLLIDIRRGSEEDNQLVTFIKGIENSPFGSNHLNSLLKSIDLEIRAVSQYLDNLASESVKCVSSDEIDSMAFDFEYILSFELRLDRSNEASISKMEEYLQTKASSQQLSSKETPWYKDGSKKRAIQRKAKLFKEFALINSTRTDTAFVIHVNSDTPPTEERGAIVLYADDEPTDFEVPSKPLKLHITEDVGEEVHLTWSKPNYGQAGINAYVVSFHSTTDKLKEETHIKTEEVVESIIVQDLVPDSEYEFCVQAECVAGLGPKSDPVKRKRVKKSYKEVAASKKSKKSGRKNEESVGHQGNQKAGKQQPAPKKSPVPPKNPQQAAASTEPIVLRLPPSRLNPQFMQSLEPLEWTSDYLASSASKADQADASPQMGFVPYGTTMSMTPERVNQHLDYPYVSSTPSQTQLYGTSSTQISFAATRPQPESQRRLPTTSPYEHTQLHGAASAIYPSHQAASLGSGSAPTHATDTPNVAQQGLSLGAPHSQQTQLHGTGSPSPSPQRGENSSVQPPLVSMPQNISKAGSASVPASAHLILEESKHNIPSLETADKLPITEKETPFGQMESPQPKNVTYKSIDLVWKRPAFGRNAVQYYSVLYHVDGASDSTLHEKKTSGPEEHITIDGLMCETGYIFRVQATFSAGIKLESEPAGPIRTKAHLAETIRRKTKLISEKTSKKPALYELNKVSKMVNKQKRMAKYEVGEPVGTYGVKVLMVVGATGAGKTTLINGIANYMYGVQWEDDFRFVLVANEPTKKSQAHSQTSWITAYTLHRGEGSPIPYSLTIIDTPGFGDTEGIERDKKIADQIKDFFSLHPPEGIDVLHGIGFVAQASLARLSPSQKYIFDSILSIYGRDVASNIFMMTTFADGQDPPVMDAITEAKIPHQTYFKFNNSALFVTGKEESFDAMFWKMGMKSFADFFLDFGRAEHRSLQLTREVLSERELLENVLKELQPQIHSGLTKMDELQRVVTLLQHNKSLIEQNKDFVIKVPVTKQRKVDTPPGRYTTNCLNCNFTCHDNCIYANDRDKINCCAMNRNGDCTVCPGNCVWSKHVNNPYIFELYDEEVDRTSKDLKDRYDTAKEGESRAETMIDNIKDELNTLEIIVLQLVDRARRSLIRLDEIALKPNPLSEVDYIDQLIKSEEQQGKLGWQERVAAYKVLRKRAALMRKIKDPKQVVNEHVFSWLGGDGTRGSVGAATLSYLKGPEDKSKKKTWYQFWK